MIIHQLPYGTKYSACITWFLAGNCQHGGTHHPNTHRVEVLWEQRCWTWSTSDAFPTLLKTLWSWANHLKFPQHQPLSLSCLDGLLSPGQRNRPAASKHSRPFLALCCQETRRMHNVTFKTSQGNRALTHRQRLWKSL